MLKFGPIVIPEEVVAWFPILIVLLIQLILCFKCRQKAFRLLPVFLLLISSAELFCIGWLVGGWTGFALAIYAYYSAILLLSSGLGWAVWALVRLLFRRGT